MLRNALRHCHQNIIVCIETFLVPQHLLSTSTGATRNLDLELERLQQEQGITRGGFDAYESLVRECGKLGVLAEAKKVHAYILQSGIKSIRIFSKYLIRMYSMCGSLQDAQKVFDGIVQPGVISWTELITAYTRNGHSSEAFQLFRQMQLAGTKPDKALFVVVLNACQGPVDLAEGKLIHACICECGFETDVTVGTTLVAMYGRCGSLDDSKRSFDILKQRDAISWNAMIGIYIQQGRNEEALDLFQAMQQQGVMPHHVDFVTILKACQKLSQVESIHEEIVKKGAECDPFVGAALIETYGRCGSVEDAARIFLNVNPRDIVTWTSLVSAYAQNGYGREALRVFHEMQWIRMRPNAITFVPVLDACASMAALTEGKLIHQRIVEEEGIEVSGALANALVNMYAKCGRLEEALSVFVGTGEKDVTSWNTVVAAAAQHGHGYAVLWLFQQMQQDGMKPNQSTFGSLLSVCCHLGLVEAGYAFFVSMLRDHVMVPSVENYLCMIDILGREGDLDEAENLISRMPYQPGAAAWMTLLGACRNHGDIERGKHAAARILALDQKNNAPVYVVLSNIYAKAGRLDVVPRLQKLMKDRGVRQESACSWIEVMAVVHEFTAEDRSHPQAEEIYAVLERLGKLMEDAGYSPHTANLVLHDVEEEVKEELLWFHSERLAVAFGIISTPENTSLRIFKNRRVCADCHTVLRIVSKITGREIIVRDATRFHCFKDASCSCGNYW